MQKRRGFTTVELVIVIAVIAILATALIPTFGGLIDSANHSADVQTAKNLSTQVMMYAMENEINDEADLRKALDAAMGEGFYDALEPKSARKGYCYWYDYNNCQIVLGTIEEIIAESQKKLAVPSDWDITMANGLTGNKDFAAGNLRGQIIPGYFLMSNDDKNPLTEVITALEQADAATYSDTIAKLNKLSEPYASNATVKKAVDDFAAAIIATPILNANGLFTTVTTISKVYVPYGIDELASTAVCVATVTDSGVTTDTTVKMADLTLSGTLKIYVPQGTRIAANILNLRRADNTDNTNPFLNGSDEFHMDIDEKDLGTYFFADTTDAVIVLPDGSRYIQNDTVFIKLDADGGKTLAVESKPYGKLNAFGVGFDDYSEKNYVVSEKVAGSDTEYNLFISADHNGKITLNASDFVGDLTGGTGTSTLR